MFRKDRLSLLLRHQQENYKSTTPEPPPRDDERVNDSLSEEVVPVSDFKLIDV